MHVHVVMFPMCMLQYDSFLFMDHLLFRCPHCSASIVLLQVLVFWMCMQVDIAVCIYFVHVRNLRFSIVVLFFVCVRIIMRIAECYVFTRILCASFDVSLIPGPLSVLAAAAMLLARIIASLRPVLMAMGDRIGIMGMRAFICTWSCSICACCSMTLL